MEVVFIVCCVWNYSRAKAANLNAGMWTFYTFLAVMIGWIVGLMIASIIMLSQDPQLQEIMMKPKPSRETLVHHLQQKNLIVTELFALFCGFGGYLFIRRLIIKRTLPTRID